MRKLAIGAAVSGALALTGLAAPAATADSPDLTFTDVVVNSGKPIVVGTTKKVTVPVTYTLARPADFTVDYVNNGVGIIAYRGTLGNFDNVLDSASTAPACTPIATSDTRVIESCATTLSVRPKSQLFDAHDAGTWKLGAFYGHVSADTDPSDDHISFESGYDIWGGLGTTKVQRRSALTVNATPEPVVKGKTLTVKGKLTRANWETLSYTGYKGQTATLQFKSKGATAYTNVKTVTSGTGGALSTTVKASKDGTYRFTFAGTSTTAGSKSVGDFVDVQ